MLRTIKSVVGKGYDNLTELCTAENRTEVIFSNREWSQLVELCDLLEPFAEATDKLQAEKVSKTVRCMNPIFSRCSPCQLLVLFQAVTVSHVVLCLVNLHNVVRTEVYVNLNTMAAALRDSLMTRFLGIYSRLKMGVTSELSSAPFNSMIYLIAIVLDPNSAMFWIDLDLRIPTEQKNELKDELKCMEFIT